ncbi:MAG: peptidoglycan-binding protein [Clostridia bacterium]|nr:peptidoglycan-binding protein [Clostridia bacterium]
MISDKENNVPVHGLQRMLRFISSHINDIPSVIPDGIYGEKTKNSVSEFQKVFGIENTGEVDNKTWDKIRETYMRLLKEKAKPENLEVFSDEVEIHPDEENMPQMFIIQSMIMGLINEFDNLKNISVNGIYDSDTVNAVKILQEIAGLEATGIIDALTFNAMCRMYSSLVSKKLEY